MLSELARLAVGWREANADVGEVRKEQAQIGPADVFERNAAKRKNYRMTASCCKGRKRGTIAVEGIGQQRAVRRAMLSPLICLMVEEPVSEISNQACAPVTSHEIGRRKVGEHTLACLRRIGAV